MFNGTDTPVQAFFEYLEAGKSPETFLNDYPAVNKKDLTELLQITKYLVSSEKVLKENLPR